MTQASRPLPVFYTREHEAYTGTRVALWTNTKPPAEGQRPWHYSGKIGALDVKLWKSKGPRGIYFNMKGEVNGQSVPVGSASAFIRQGQNALSISLRYPSAEEAQTARETLEIKEKATHWRDGIHFINVFADVSIKAIEANPELFGEMGFNADVASAAPKRAPAKKRASARP